MNVTDYYDIKELTDIQRIQLLVDKLLKTKIIEQKQFEMIKNYLDKGMLLKNGLFFDEFFKQHFPDNKYVNNMTKIHEIKYLIKTMKKDRKNVISFTKERVRVLRKLLITIYDHNIKMFGMYGYAGTGKTTLMMELIRFLLINKLIKSVAFIAPTHKALNIMKTNFSTIINNIIMNLKLKDEGGFENNIIELRSNGYNVEFRTIHSLMGYSMNMMGDGERKFTRENKFDICKYDLIIVDECSMIPLQMIVELLDEIRKQWKKQDFGKLPTMIFTGDPAQLPPVNEKSSAIFIKEESMLSLSQFEKLVEVKEDEFTKTNTNEEAYKNFITDITSMKTRTLTQIFRNKSSNVMDMCFNIRQWVNDEIPNPTLRRYIGNGVYLYKNTGGDKTKTVWFKKCIESFQKDNTSNIILTWTNNATQRYNDALRQILRVKQDNKDSKINKYEIGDVLILNDFYCPQLPDGNDTTEKSRFYTSEQFKVRGIKTSQIKIKPIDDLLMLEQAKFQKMFVIVRKYRTTIAKINELMCKLYNVWQLDVIQLSNNSEYQDDTVFPLNIIHDSSYSCMSSESEQVATIIRKLYKDYQMNHSIHLQLIDKIIMKKLWGYWNNSFTEQYANVIYGYSVTTHKAQGSTFNNVFIDADDILLNNNLDETKRCIYTSHTRSANEVHILI